ncbi:cobalamin-binding protein [Rhodocyclaceae bacterium SMB388]
MNPRQRVRAAVALIALTASLAAGAVDPLTVVDDTGRTVRLAGPAERIVSLAPHVTEVLFAAGAGAHVVGVVAYSDYPEAARSLPQVGGYSNVDLEAIVALRPDLVVAWASGNRHAHLDKLEALGIPVYLNESRDLAGVARSIEQFGLLAGTGDVAGDAAAAFRARWQSLAERHAHRPTVRMFYQIWNEPLMTVNGQHLISDVIRLCGGENVFAELDQLAPRIGVEAVLTRAPEVIVASGMGEARPEWLDAWRDWPGLPAAEAGNLHFIPPDILQRHTPRILDGAERLCGFLEAARGKRPTD